MRYSNQEIGLKPTIEQIEGYICRKKLKIEAKDVFAYYEKRNWCKKNGAPLLTLEAAINAYNGVVISR